jgi:hypothetical protein
LRVLANRLWQNHFGRGLVRSSNEFGRLGELPTHPELLDWLAVELRERGLRLAAMHRLIMTSAAYRRASAADPEALAADPLNDLFWRFDMRRLSAEEIRDAILQVNGTLDLTLGGPSVFPPMPSAILATSSKPDLAWGKSTPGDAARRSLYVHLKRSMILPVLAAFDLADTDASCAMRFSTTQPTQALTMLNGEFANDAARAFAQRLTRDADTREARIALGLRLVTCRTPSPETLRRATTLCDDLVRAHGVSAERALELFCLVLLNLDEFLYLD